MATDSTPAATPAATSPPRWKRWLRPLLVFVAIPYVAVVALVTVFQRSLIYQPTRVAALPATRALLNTASAELVTTTTDDGLKLHGWWLTAKRNPSKSESIGGQLLVLYFCGNAGHREYRMHEFQILTEGGADVLCCDYRGYGENPGSPSEEGLASDARAAWDFATRVREIPPERIVIFGESLGGGVAVRLAADLCTAGTPPAGLALRSTFSSLTDVATGAFPWLPVRWLLLDRFESDKRISQLTCPMLMLHGRRDTIVPYELGLKLFEAAPDQSSNQIARRLVDLPTADHNDVLETEGRTFRNALFEFLERIDRR